MHDIQREFKWYVVYFGFYEGYLKDACDAIAEMETRFIADEADTGQFSSIFDVAHLLIPWYNKAVCFILQTAGIYNNVSRASTLGALRL